MRMTVRTSPETVTGLASPLAALRRASLGISVMLVAQFVLGIGVNLYLEIPKSGRGRGLVAAAVHALSHPPVALAVHAGARPDPAGRSGPRACDGDRLPARHQIRTQVLSL